LELDDDGEVDLRVTFKDPSCDDDDEPPLALILLLDDGDLSLFFDGMISIPPAGAAGDRVDVPTPA